MKYKNVPTLIVTSLHLNENDQINLINIYNIY